QHLRPEQAAALRDVLAQAAPALEQARGLEGLTAGRLRVESDRPLLVHVPLDNIQVPRSVASLFSLHAQLQAQDGQVDAALDSCRQTLAAARAADAQPMLISGLVCMAIRAVAAGRIERVLAQGEPGADALARLQAALDAEVARPLSLDALRGER